MPSQSRPIAIYVKGVTADSGQLGAIGIAYEGFSCTYSERVPDYLRPITESTATFWVSKLRSVPPGAFVAHPELTVQAILHALKCHPSTRRGDPGAEIEVISDNELCIATLLLYKAAKNNDIEDFNDFCPSDEGVIDKIMRQLQCRKRDTVHFRFLLNMRRGSHEDALA